MENFSGLKVFVRVAETRSFVDAGRQLGLSASAIGKSVARLEERLGVRLFHRSTHSVNLTPEGAIFLERCRRILAEMELATQEMQQARMVVRGTIRVSLPTWAVTFMPVFARFMQIYPQARLELDLTDRLVDVIDEGYDLVIRTGDMRDSRLMSRTVGHFRHTIVASPAYLAAHGIPQRPEDLLQHLCLHRRHPETGRIDTWPLAEEGADIELDLPITAVVNTVEARIELAEQGVGIACVPSMSVSTQIQGGRLVPLLQDCVREAGVLRLLWPASSSPSHNIRTLVDFIAQSAITQRS
ncbi:LysR family transcriptional regulator [Agrobacterium rhizogenes]|uniref:HTH-type transcriptional regulator TtuA n=1 Tax=Rhizobium rhizogenes NBRC 13257 TaxID=1220581 RepID=A0AA87Q8B1_RHIRH|nr:MULTISPECIES: LysR family transcriptional regulator [Rhizobium]OCJ10452.1 LysR family transcriptional regulator [Agrobacterium sp. B131/95]OCJ15295.1 LysR family transcriptional regulator [Agrobacterium sp. B133/95]EJK85324.1 transcriptional regulator [Rhizobium sp. AP16]KEA08915.1 LysR family transcriptional regulator [Rhizobium rhizogenes]MDJ1633823.1 LysR family transcriptional regulator [Rhizobium rhizogenes]